MGEYLLPIAPPTLTTQRQTTAHSSSNPFNSSIPVSRDSRSSAQRLHSPYSLLAALEQVSTWLSVVCQSGRLIHSSSLRRDDPCPPQRATPHFYQSTVHYSSFAAIHSRSGESREVLQQVQSKRYSQKGHNKRWIGCSYNKSSSIPSRCGARSAVLVFSMDTSWMIAF